MLPQFVETLLTARARSKQTDEQLAEAAGISRAAFKRRLREPGTLWRGGDADGRQNADAQRGYQAEVP